MSIRKNNNNSGCQTKNSFILDNEIPTSEFAIPAVIPKRVNPLTEVIELFMLFHLGTDSNYSASKPVYINCTNLTPKLFVKASGPKITQSHNWVFLAVTNSDSSLLHIHQSSANCITCCIIYQCTHIKSFKADLIKSVYGVSQGPSAPLACLRVYVWSWLQSITVSSILYQCISKRAREPHRSESGSLPHSTYPRHLSSVSERANTLHRWRSEDCKNEWFTQYLSLANPRAANTAVEEWIRTVRSCLKIYERHCTLVVMWKE